MTRIQKIFLALLPAKWAADAEQQSKRWLMRCPDCQTEFSVWDLGGIRWQAVGNPHRLVKCPACGKTNTVQLHKRETE